MIITRLEGGLGNIMYQYALGRHLAHKNGAPLKFDVHSFESNPLGDYSFALEAFGIDIRNNLATDKEIRWFKRFQRRPGRKWFLYNKLIADRSRYMQERQYNFDPDVLAVTDPAYLHGWWQTEHYFLPIRDLLLEDFTVRTPLSQRNKEVWDAMQSTDSISIHIRRCDYVKNPVTRAWFGELTKQYYDEALAQITPHLTVPNLFIFSDDIIWAEQNMRFPYPSTYVSWNTEDLGHEDLRLMSAAKHNIIANSTLGWWGAWLNRNPEKIVVAPAKWFRNAPKNNEQDLVPKSWIRVPSYFAD